MEDSSAWTGNGHLGEVGNVSKTVLEQVSRKDGVVNAPCRFGRDGRVSFNMRAATSNTR